MIGRRARGGRELPERLEALDAAVDLAQGRLDDEAVAFARQVAGKAEDRLRHGTTHTLVALLGATGSGKSSVTNLVAGSEVATTGVRRPTTSSTLACIWAAAGSGPDAPGTGTVSALLDWLEVVNRHRVGQPAEATPGPDPETDPSPDLEGLILLDVPDHDSVATAHREEMERIAEHADVLVWVTDPEKYADKALHDYLARLSGHGAVMTVVLNKVDLLDEGEAAACRHDLARLLAGAGLAEILVLPLSARTGEGAEGLVDAVHAAVVAKQAAVERLSADIDLAVRELRQAAGSSLSSGDAIGIPKRAIDRLARELVTAAGVEVVSEAVAAGHRRDGARSTGWPFTRWLRRLRPHPLGRLHLDRGSTGRASLPTPSGAQQARTQGALREVAATAAADLPEPWPSHIRAAARPAEGELADRIDVAVAGAVRSGRSRNPRWWAAIGALQWALTAAVVAGAAWLGILALFAYLRLPDPPTPDIRGIPIPTGLLIGGVALGLLVAAVSGRLVRLGAKREARAVRSRAERAVAEVADELVIEPMEAELRRFDELRQHLERAGR